MKRPRIQHVSIPRPPGSHDATRAFYGDLLGLEEKVVPGTIQQLDLIWYNIGENMELHLFTEEPVADTSGRQYRCIYCVRPARSEPGGSHRADESSRTWPQSSARNPPRCRATR